MTPSYSLQRRLAWRLGILFLVATAAVSAGLFYSAYEALDASGAAAPNEDTDAFVHAMFREYFADVFWLVALFVGVTLLVGYLTLASAFGSLAAVSRQAASIEPPASGVRLPTAGVPNELQPLLVAVNDALDRLETGFATQRDLMANAAHQLRTPLAALSARLDEFREAAPETAAAIRGDVRRLSRLVNQLLKMARFASQPVELSAVDLRAIAQETVSFLAPLAIQRGLSVALGGSPAPVVVRGNAGAIGDALTNVIENAIEHAPAGSEVEVEVDGTGVTVRVADRGPGFPDEFRAHAFERFWRGNQNRYQGAGLGLAIVAEVMQQHGGTVSVDARTGGGAVVSLHFAAT